MKLFSHVSGFHLNHEGTEEWDSNIDKKRMLLDSRVSYPWTLWTWNVCNMLSYAFATYSMYPWDTTDIPYPPIYKTRLIIVNLYEEYHGNFDNQYVLHPPRPEILNTLKIQLNIPSALHGIAYSVPHIVFRLTTSFFTAIGTLRETICEKRFNIRGHFWCQIACLI